MDVRYYMQVVYVSLFRDCVCVYRMSFTEYGTILFISSLEYTPDGRSLVTTMGERRFRVLQRGSTDGYSTARIQFITDNPVVGDEEIGERASFKRTS